MRGRIKFRFLGLAGVLIAGSMGAGLARITRAEHCPDIRAVFARGSGGARWTDQNYLEFKRTIEEKLKTTALSYEFIDLDYPAVGVGLEHLGTTLGAFFGSGEAYEFGESVQTGVNNLKSLVKNDECTSTKYVIGGYSQGAMVASRAVRELPAEKVVYLATFGDPKIYLPEGKGPMPEACYGRNLSDWRKYVPDCQVYKGLLGANIPYQPEGWKGKVGTWCNKRDFFCSTHLNLRDHSAYVAEQLYEDASRVIFDQIAKTFRVENQVTSPHETAIVIDSSGSMSEMIEKYKAEALRLAQETLAAGGRVALYDYRDLDDPYSPVERCGFSTCTLDSFVAGLAEIKTDGGGDDSESLLSASFQVMQAQKWRFGATKSLVVLTDANFLSPDRDGIGFDEVVRLSKTIDPVNFYIITKETEAENYRALAEVTGGKVVTNLDELSLLTDYIMARYDSLPRVEEGTVLPRPGLEVTGVEQSVAGDGVKIRFRTDGQKVLVFLNDYLLGETTETEVMIRGLRAEERNVIRLVPLGEEVRGEGEEVALEGKGSISEAVTDGASAMKAPNAGGR